MKRYLGLLLAIVLLGMLSEGDASFGGAAAMCNGCIQLHEYMQKKFGDRLNQFWQNYAPDFNKPLRNQYFKTDSRSKKQMIGRGYLGWGHRFEKSKKRLKECDTLLHAVDAQPSALPVQKREIVQPEPIKQESPKNVDVLNSLVQMLVDTFAQMEKRIVKQSDDKIDALTERIDRVIAKQNELKYTREIQPISTVASAVAPSANFVQSAVPQQPVYQNALSQNSMQPIAACAMQLQASAMAMQAQASAMMMQATQPQVVPSMQHAGSLYGAQSSNDDKQDKLNRLIQKISVLGMHGTALLLQLLDVEFNIIEHLLGGSSGQHIDNLLKKRNVKLRQSSPLLISAYELILDLATTSNNSAENSKMYLYYVRKGRSSKKSSPTYGRKKFLRNMIVQLEKYYEMIEKMQPVMGQ